MQSNPVAHLSLCPDPSDSSVEHARGDATPDPDAVAHALRTGESVDEDAFDRFLPDALQVVSDQYWTPLVAATRAAQWFERLGIRSVVDIGSGAGKFCVAAALASRCEYTGLEQRNQLVAAAQELSFTFGVEDRVRFLLGTFGEMETPEADAYYVFNPFEENFFGSDSRLDDAIELSPTRYARDIGAMTRLLMGADLGTYLLTYNGFGGSVPATYRQVLVDRSLPNVLRLWRKVQRTSDGRPYHANGG